MIKRRWLTIAVFLLTAITTQSLAQQDWEFNVIDTERKPNVQILVLDPSIPCCGDPDRYKRIAIEDLLRGLVVFDDGIKRYVAVKENRNDFTSADMLSGHSGVGNKRGIRVGTGVGEGVIGVAIPHNPDLSPHITWGYDTSNPGRNGISSFIKQTGTLTIDDVVYEVWGSINYLGADLSQRAIYFTADAQPPLPDVYVANPDAVAEGNAVEFTVKIIGSREASVTVDYATETDTAVATDFTATSGTLTFATSDTMQTVSVPTVDDSDMEQSESFNLVLSDPVGAYLQDDMAVGTITDND